VMTDPVIIVHGGAWDIPNRLVDLNLRGVEDAVGKGWSILKTSGSALDAVIAAVNSLEDNPTFDAGIGAVLTEDGTVEMRAMTMERDPHRAGSVAGLRDVKHPIDPARTVMEKTPHVLMIGEGARRLAEKYKIERPPQDKLVADEARRELAEWLAARKQ